MKDFSQKGFTLIELMIVVAIIGILASAAVAYYGDNVISARRTDARSALLDTSTRLEKCKTIYGTYNNASCSIGNGDSVASPDGHYDISVVSAASTFTLTASPSAGSPQAKDDDCTSLILNHLGQQTGTGADSTTCW